MGIDRGAYPAAGVLRANARDQHARGGQGYLLHWLHRQWRLLPKNLPPHTVQRYFYAWRDSSVWQTINHVLLMEMREAAGRKASPTAGVIDSRRSRPPRPVVRAVMRPKR